MVYRALSIFTAFSYIYKCVVGYNLQSQTICVVLNLFWEVYFRNEMQILHLFALNIIVLEVNHHKLALSFNLLSLSCGYFSAKLTLKQLFFSTGSREKFFAIYNGDSFRCTNFNAANICSTKISRATTKISRVTTKIWGS